MTFEELFNFFVSIQIWDVAKILVSFTLLIYIIFAFVVVKQVNLMTETINQMEFPLKAIAAIHFVGAILIFLLALITL